NLKKNTKIVTVGGLYGVITDIKDDYVRIRIADKVEIKLKKESISAIAGDEED
ncbi:MAG TPA: preprotein translocase subunit YajC, partial [Megasphaera sp.]|nr:preprotein translocase subunit YajC [Megasphaera sp.]